MSSKEPRGLGRGLGALLGDNVNIDSFRKPVGYVNKEVAGVRPSQDSSDVLRIPLEKVEANPWQPRIGFDQDALEELAASIRTLGLIQPITVRKVAGGRYQIISGERRFKACQLAGMSMIPAYVRDANDQGMLEMAIVENIQRENLDPIETALSFQRLIDECNLTQEALADRVGKKRASVANTLRLLKLPVKVQHDLKVGLLSTGHAKVLLSLPDSDTQEQFCDLVIKEGLSVRELEEAVRRFLKGGVPAKRRETKPSELPEEYTKVLSHIGKFFSEDISVHRNASGKGTLTVKFSSDEEVRAFLSALEKANV